MDRNTVFTKTAKGLMEATGKTSALSRDMRAILKEIDGKATVEEVQTNYGKLPEAKLQEALDILAKGDFIREFVQSAAPAARSRAAPPPGASKKNSAEGEMDLDFTAMIPTVSTIAKQAEEAARQKAQAEAAARAQAAAKAKAAAATAARAKAEAEARAKAKAEAEAKTRAEAAARAKAETEAKARAEAEARARAEAEARARREAEERARKEAEDRARKEAEEKARREADELRAKLEEERKAHEEAERKAKEQAERERKQAEEEARREAEDLRAKLEEERKAREEAERKAKEAAERERKEAEEKARREADELRARLDEERHAREAAERQAKEAAERREKEEAERKAREDAERQAREEAERKARGDAERARREAEEKAHREADELRARLDEERQAREQAERKAQGEAERRAREDAERQARAAAERQRREAEDAARREAEAQARRKAEERARAQDQERVEAEARARRETADAQRRAEEDAARKAREEVERKAREDAERARREAEEKARREDAEKSARVTAEKQQTPVKSGPTLEDLVNIETNFDAVLAAGGAAASGAAQSSAAADDKLRKEVEEQARLQAEEQADKEAQEQARAEANAEAKRAAQESSRREEERQQASTMDAAAERAAVQAREHAEAQALLDAQNAETERHFADMEKELEAEQAMTGGRIQPSESLEAAHAREQEETRKRVRAAAAAQAVEAEQEAQRAPAAYRRRINWGRPVAIGLFLLVVLGLIAVHFVSFDTYIPQFEKLAGAHMQQPVKIKALRLSLVPQPHWRLEGVSVGAEGQLVVPRINAIAELGSMFSEKKVLTSIELESPVLGEDGLLALLFGKAAGQDLKIAKISVKNGKLDSKTFILPALDAKITFGDDGAWRQIALETPDHKTSLLLKPEGEGATLEVETNAFSLPFHPSFILENLVATGTIRRGELRLNEFKGGIYGGYLSGNADLKWGAGWSLGGEISVRAMDPARFVPALMEEGKLEGKAQYAMRAKSYDELFAAPRLEGSFTVLKGALLGVDLARLLQGGGVGGKTVFTELTGGFVREAGRTQLRQMVLVAGPVSAGGSAEVDAGKHLSGRYTVEIKSPVAKARANLAVAGTLREPRFSRQ